MLDAQPPLLRLGASTERQGPCEHRSGLIFGWERYVGAEGVIVGVNRFGTSAPAPVVMREFGFPPEHIVETVKTALSRR